MFYWVINGNCPVLISRSIDTYTQPIHIFVVCFVFLRVYCWSVVLCLVRTDTGSHEQV